MARIKLRLLHYIYLQVMLKGKAHPRTCQEGTEWE